MCGWIYVAFFSSSKNTFTYLGSMNENAVVNLHNLLCNDVNHTHLNLSFGFEVNPYQENHSFFCVKHSDFHK